MPLRLISFLISLVVANALLKTGLPRALRAKTALDAKVAEVIKEAGCFTKLLAAVEAAGLGEALNQPGPFSLFAPSDDAFEKLPPGTLDSLLKDKEKLSNLLKFHIVPEKMKPTRNGKNFDTLCMGEDGFPKQIVCKVTNWSCEMFLFGGQKEPAQVTTPPGNCDSGSNYQGVVCDNGVIHQVNEVLIPYEGTVPPKITHIGAGDIDGTKTLQMGFYGSQAGSGFAKWYKRDDLSVLDPIKVGKDWTEAGNWKSGHEKDTTSSEGYTGKK